MSALVIAANGAADSAGLLLCLVAWKHRAVFAGVWSGAAVALAVAAISVHPSTRVAWTLLILELVALVIGLAVLTLGQLLWRLLADPSEDDPSR
jgi:hypothetical protein